MTPRPGTRIQSAASTGGSRGSPLLYVFLFVTGLGIALSGLLGVWRSGHAETLRNYHHSRGWLEHAGKALPRQAGEKLVILIGNSQGFGQEIRDEETYAALLEKKLEKSWGKTRVLNWSITGGTAPDFVFLGAAAARLDPDALVLIASAGNFDASFAAPGGSRKQRKPWSSDAYRLLAIGEVRNLVPTRFQDRFLAFPDRLDIALGTLSIWRHRYVVGGWFARHEALRPFQPGNPVEVGPKRSAPELSIELLDFYLEATQSVKGQNLIVQMPVQSRWRNEIESVLPVLKTRLDEAKRPWIDWSDLVPDEEFLTQTHVTHRGHAALARALAEALAP